MNVNQIAFCASTTLATATIAITFAAVTAVALPAKVALIALAVLSGSVSGTVSERISVRFCFNSNEFIIFAKILYVFAGYIYITKKKNYFLQS